MTAKFVSERNLRFLLYEIFDVTSLCEYRYYEDHHPKVFEMVLKAASKLGKDLLCPVFTEMDRKPPELVRGEVRVHPAVKSILKAFGEGGWIASRAPFDRDGEQLPHLIADACDFIFQAANYSAAAYAGLTAGASGLIETFGSRELYKTYVPNMRSGRWQGTMALTEPEAGSSLSDLTTTAHPADGGYYLISGQKIFISAGDHDGADNIIHLMLARIEGAPPGVKGISLFVVPKKRLDARGGLESNDVATSGLYHKLGYRGCPIVQLSLGDGNDCRGWLVGKPHHGLSYMFRMMNEARIGVGMGATAMATAAYYAALDYAGKRRQGRSISNKDPAQPQVPIIQHADVRRMLLFQRSVAEGALALILQCSRYVDMTKVLFDEEKKPYLLLLEILTPVAKSYPSEMGILAISQGLQCLGGSGYCDDYPLEQYFRDCRIHPIHEGTTGIQAMDLLGRKIVLEEGRAFALYTREVESAISEAGRFPELKRAAEQLDQTLARLKEVTGYLIGVAKTRGPAYFLSDATLYLEFFGTVAIAWQWLLQGIAIEKAAAKNLKKSEVEFYRGKRTTMNYFYRYELPKTKGLAERLMDNDGLTVEMNAEQFND